ncbi:response regulator [Pleurocapsa sp. PCC 7319]|uniref:hybrid sensor histidine kinase/response regulator n=1 Tax=Pleurocapsa sp. PCC 7319 TaxID=118161 RepID=UPI0003466EBD|nr:response regulator [Pleurocapsa sp. PCC 7319]
MDSEQQIRLNFLDEVEEYFDRMESNLLGLANAAIDPQQLDIVLRAAHSIKGGAAMMGFNVLSQVAHRLEDYFKILRVRHTSGRVSTLIETLLLEGVDSLRYISELNRQGVVLVESEPDDYTNGTFAVRTQPIFKQLKLHLGVLEDADEDALIAQDENIDPALLIFEEGVDRVLEGFTSQLEELSSAELTQELIATAQELASFGMMANLETFIQLSKSIQQQAEIIAPQEIFPLAEQALKVWRRSHALVVRGSIEKLPSCLENMKESNDIVSLDSSTTADNDDTDSQTQEILEDSSIEINSNLLEDNSLELSELESVFEAAQQDVDFNLLEDNSLELSELESVFEAAQQDADFNLLEDNSLELSELGSAFETAQQDADFNLLEDNSLEVSELELAFEQKEQDVDSHSSEDNSLGLSELELALGKTEQDVDSHSLEDNSLELNERQSASESDTLEIEEETQILTSVEAQNPLVPLSLENSSSAGQVDEMVRVPAAQLKQFNNIFEQLIVDRNTINLRLQQLQYIISLMKQRMARMEKSNTQLKQWYDRAALEGFLVKSSQTLSGQSEATGTNTKQSNTKQSFPNPDISLNSDNFAEEETNNKLQGNSPQDNFDVLEMDRYTDIHLICQEQIETIVQLQEVTTDIELGAEDINHAVRDLRYTTKSMQGNVIRTQMIPFAEVVKRFPRVIRDLNLQSKKQVNLKIKGDNTLIDRSVVKALGDPLIQLLRNAFDHGIEDTDTRVDAGKPPSGTITIQASNQGTYNIVTLSDDGGGICLDKIQERLLEMGMTQSEVEQIPEAELLDFIFDPGFSTSEKVTQLSGRGVGMDVVQTNLQAIRGDVRVATKQGQGTTFTLKIPFTLSILRVAIVEQAGIIFAIPASSIQELIPVRPGQIKTTEDTKNILWNQQEIPLVEIERALVYHRCDRTVNLISNPAINKTMAIVVEDENSFTAIQISHFYHEQESTIRSIDSPIPLPPGVISSVVFGDGKVIPLIDPQLLIEECLNNQASKYQFEQKSNKNQNRSATKTILIVDDSINIRRYLSLTLEKAGYRVEQAKDGQEAVDKLLSGLSVQLIICDIEMPLLDGYGLLEEIKERAEFADLPIAMLTSRSNEKHRKLAMNLGAVAYFAKPYNEQELLAKLAELLQK